MYINFPFFLLSWRESILKFLAPRVCSLLSSEWVCSMFLLLPQSKTSQSAAVSPPSRVPAAHRTPHSYQPQQSLMPSCVLCQTTPAVSTAPSGRTLEIDKELEAVVGVDSQPPSGKWSSDNMPLSFLPCSTWRELETIIYLALPCQYLIFPNYFPLKIAQDKLTNEMLCVIDL